MAYYYSLLKDSIFQIPYKKACEKMHLHYIMALLRFRLYFQLYVKFTEPHWLECEHMFIVQNLIDNLEMRW